MVAAIINVSIIVLVGCSSTEPSEPQPPRYGMVQGIVVAATEGDTVVGIEVTTGSRLVRTDSAGRFEFDSVIVGMNRFEVSAPDRLFQPPTISIEVRESDTMELEFLMLRRRRSDSIVMVAIHPGTFMMGNDISELLFDSLSVPRHRVTITKPYYIGAREVTQREWDRLMGGNPSTIKDPDLPVMNVTFEEIAVYCNRLSELFGLEPVYLGVGRDITADHTRNGFRLPTEAEWEFAASAGDTTALYGIDDPINDYTDLDYAVIIKQINQYAWTEDNSGGSQATAQPVGQLQPNAWGLYDMIGNVREAVEDQYSRFPADPQIDPLVTGVGSYRMVRGSSFGSLTLNEHSLRYRTWNNLFIRNAAVGFRVARN